MEFLHNLKASLTKFWSPIPAVIALGVLSTYYFGITGTYWAVTGEFTRWGGHFLQLFNIDVSTWGYYKIMNIKGSIFTRVDGVMIIGMFAGCIAAAFWGNNVKFRLPINSIRIAQALIGGIIAGFGARLGMGCNLASFFTGIPQFSFHAWVFTAFMIVGVYFGVKVALHPLLQSKIKMQKVTSAKILEHNQKKVKNFFIFGTLVFIAIIFWSLYLIFVVNSAKLGMAMFFGSLFGIIIAKAQVCFTSAFRDIFTTGRSELAKAIIIGMVVATLGVFAFITLGQTAKIMWAGPNVVIGGFLFGFGIVLAGGCECGWMYRAVEGQVHFWIVGVGNIIGSTLLAFVWDDISPALATSWPKINLLESFGNYGGLIVNYSLLLLFFVLILALEKRYLKKSRNR